MEDHEIQKQKEQMGNYKTKPNKFQIYHVNKK